MSPLTDLHVVVTGGTGALGSAVVEKFLAGGAICHVPYYSERELEAWDLGGQDRVVTSGPLDLTDAEANASFYAELPSLWASVHVAGGFSMGAIEDTEVSEFRRLMELNATTCFASCKNAVSAIRRRQGRGPAGGRIVNVSARPALVPTAQMSAYAASKAAVAALSQGLAEELAPEDIWVNAIVPSIIDTPTNRRAMPDADFESWPKPSQLAQTIVNLCAPQNECVRGALIPVYGRS